MCDKDISDIYQAKLRAIDSGKHGVSQHGASIVRDRYAGFRDIPNFSNPNNSSSKSAADPDDIKYYRLFKRIAGGSNSSTDMYR
jgi:hypothetical protein